MSDQPTSWDGAVFPATAPADPDVACEHPRPVREHASGQTDEPERLVARRAAHLQLDHVPDHRRIVIRRFEPCRRSRELRTAGCEPDGGRAALPDPARVV